MNKTQINSIREEERILGMFLSSDPLRSELQKAFRIGDKVYAANTHSIISIGKTLLSGEYDDSRSEKMFAQKTASYFSVAQNSDIVIPIEKISNAVKKSCTKEETAVVRPGVVCPECNGIAEVEYEYRDKDFYDHTIWGECPICSGTGYIKPETTKKTGRMLPEGHWSILINGVRFLATEIYKIHETMKMLDVREIVHSVRVQEGPNKFSIGDEISFIVMGCSLDVDKEFIIEAK